MQRETIYKGATRPAMKFGVPLVPLVALFATGMLAIVWIGPLVSWWVVVPVLATTLPALGWMRLVTARDDQRFRQAFISAALRLKDRNRRFWKARSYTPYCYRGGRDAGLR